MRRLILIVPLVVGCPGHDPPGRARTTATPSPAAPPDASAHEGGARIAEATRCGELECLAFDAPAAAFAHLLNDHPPRVLAIGEAHAPVGSDGVDSSAKRFREILLPMLHKRASDVVVEVVIPAANCGDAPTRVVDKVAKPVTSGQRATNKSEYVELGDRARALTIQPWALTPSCEQYRNVAAAGDDGVLKMLPLIAQLTRERIESLLQKRPPDAMLVAYGGALHNDLHPSREREDWSFGPALAQKTGGRYLELDLIVPEYIKDNDTWRKLPWYPHYDRARHGGKTTLFRVAPNSYVLIFSLS